MQPGLDDVVAAETVLSHTWVRGVALPDPISAYGSEGTVALPAGFRRQRPHARRCSCRSRCCAYGHICRTGRLARCRRWALFEAFWLTTLPDDAPPARIVATLSVGDPALLRVARNKAPMPSDPIFGTAADVLRTLHRVSPHSTPISP